MCFFKNLMFSRLANDSASANELAIGCEIGWKPIFR